MEAILHDIHRAHREITETRLLLVTLLAAPILEIPLIMAALDTLNTANTSLDESLAALPGAMAASNAAAVAAAVPPAVAAAEADFQTAADATAAKAASLASAVGDLNKPAPAGGNTTEPVTTAASLTVEPTSASFAAGVASSVALTIAGGVAPYTASGEPAGVTFDGASLNADDTTVASPSPVTVTIHDSTTPVALTAEVPVTIS